MFQMLNQGDTKMALSIRHMTTLSIAACTAMMVVGCSQCERCGSMGDIRPAPLGTISDSVWQQQESNAEASDFVIHEHEWDGNNVVLNSAGKDHVKQIAVRAAETPFPIIIERASMSVDRYSKYKYPVHGDEALDGQRRQLVVNALLTMGVQDADDRVVVSPALTPGFTQFEAERAYSRGIGGGNRRGGGGGFGGGGIGGGGGGF